jgi:phosphoglycerate kinase
MTTISSEAARNKKIIIRLDLDVPLTNGTVKDTTRLTAILPTLQLLSHAAAQTIIIGHLGRPEGKVVPDLSLKPVAQALSQLLGETITFVDTLDQPINPQDKTIMLENLRFYPGEEANDPGFTQQLASFGDLFVFEAFAVSHRAAASTVGITQLLPSFAGLRVATELKNLSLILDQPTHPLLVIIGGAKIETKLPVINNLLSQADNIFVGGRLPKEIQEKNMTFPEKVVIAHMNDSGLDIDQASQTTAVKLIENAKMIVWNGPVGKFEDPTAQKGTQTIANAIARSSAQTIIGGGETNEAVTQFGVQDKIYFTSVGGGAMLEFLSGKQLPALTALNK